MNTTIKKLIEDTIIREIFFSADYWHVYLVTESIDALKHDSFTICFRDCNIIKCSILSSTINIRINKIDMRKDEDGRIIVHIISKDNDNAELVLSCSEITKYEI